MKATKIVEQLFKNFLPSPFTIAVLLTLFTFLLAMLFTKPETDSILVYGANLLQFWESGLWSNSLLVFAYQMMLILVLGHVLVLSTPVSNLILKVIPFCNSTANSAMIVASTTMLVAFFNWGLGLIFGALLARKVAEHAQQNNIPLNYPIIGAAGYSGLMVWHGGISGSAPIKINEAGHLKSMLTIDVSNSYLAQIPEIISYKETIFSHWNLIIFASVLIVISLLFYVVGKRLSPTEINLNTYLFHKEAEAKTRAEKLDSSSWLAYGFGGFILVGCFIQYADAIFALQITPNLINAFMFGLALMLHGSFRSFTHAIGEAIGDISGILIQFPLYFGIMGIMNQSGMVVLISDFFASIADATTLPIFTFFSAGLVNIFVPSGGGQWVVQGPIVIESALKLGVPLPKAIMALAYGDQITNMLQPFWALPLLGITKLRAKEILPYTLLAMLVGGTIYIIGLTLV